MYNKENSKLVPDIEKFTDAACVSDYCKRWLEKGYSDYETQIIEFKTKYMK